MWSGSQWTTERSGLPNKQFLCYRLCIVHTWKQSSPVINNSSPDAFHSTNRRPLIPTPSHLSSSPTIRKKCPHNAPLLPQIKRLVGCNHRKKTSLGMPRERHDKRRKLQLRRHLIPLHVPNPQCRWPAIVLHRHEPIVRAETDRMDANFLRRIPIFVNSAMIHNRFGETVDLLGSPFCVVKKYVPAELIFPLRRFRIVTTSFS